MVEKLSHRKTLLSFETERKVLERSGRCTILEDLSPMSFTEKTTEGSIG